MSQLSRRLLRWLVALLIVVVLLGVLAAAAARYFLHGLAPYPYDRQKELARVVVPHGASVLACSPDGSYLAAGAWGWGSGNEEPEPSEVCVVGVDRKSALGKLQVPGMVQGLAFSPDGKWLAVAAHENTWHGVPDPAGEKKPPPPGPEPAELIVFDVPAFTAKLTARSGKPENGFIDLAWAPDSKTLYALDKLRDSGEVRRWDVPAFTEQPALRPPGPGQPNALAISPDGRTLALTDAAPGSLQSLPLRLIDIGGGAEKSSCKIEADTTFPPRLGFTADGKAVGLFDGQRQKLSWWDATTGQTVTPAAGRFATQPAALYDYGPHGAVSPDDRKLAYGYTRTRGFGDLGWDNRQWEFGSFVRLTEAGTDKTWTWRVGEMQGTSAVPALVFLPDGKRLAGTVHETDHGLVMIWAVPDR